MSTEEDPLARMAGRLRQLQLRAGRPSLNDLVRLTAAQGKRRAMKRSTIQEKLKGISTPDFVQVQAIVDACRRYAEEIGHPLPVSETDPEQWHGYWTEMAQAQMGPRSQQVRGRHAEAMLPREPVVSPAGPPESFREIPSATAPPTGSTVGGGPHPSQYRPFQDVFTKVNGPAQLGQPNGDVHEDGGAFVQYFEAVWLPESMLICALPGQKPVAMPASVWEALGAAGGAPQVGMPDQDSFIAPDQPLIERDATLIELSGGSLGPGQLVRANNQQPWQWLPKPHLIQPTGRGHSSWRPTAEPDLLIRAFAVLPWQGQEGFRISKAGRNRLLAALTACEFSQTVAALAGRLGALQPSLKWEREPDASQNNRSAQYIAVLPTSPQGPVATARVMLHCPSGIRPVITTAAELRMEIPLANSPRQQEIRHDGRPGIADLKQLFVTAWHAATEIAPQTITSDPAAVPLIGQPSVEFSVETSTSDRPSVLSDVLDLSAFGASSRPSISEMRVAVTAPVGIDRAAQERWVTEALIDMANGHGFVDVDATAL
ncbi:hypothetical protein [Streptomyces sp. MK7]|uniref:hypothetical protein n=1 Tax=Streptomyces sp. MK7 TaxID=3067635 RepID=UPI002930E8E7|nr:hypothetical protein [Streptomyces sp. MK7]